MISGNDYMLLQGESRMELPNDSILAPIGFFPARILTDRQHK